MKDLKLDKCPFCNSEDVEIEGGHLGAYVCCNECGAIGPDADSEEEAALFWNERKSGFVEIVVC